MPEFVEVGSPTDDELHSLLQTVITRLMKMLTRRGVLVEEMGQTYLAEPDGNADEARTLRSLQAAAITYRIAFGPRAGQKVLTLRGATPRETAARQPLCAEIDGFSLHGAVRVEAHDRKWLEQLCRYITRPAPSDERVQLNAAGQVELKLKTSWRDGTTHLVISPLEFMQRLAALIPFSQASAAESANGSFAAVNLGMRVPGLGRESTFTPDHGCRWQVVRVGSGRQIGTTHTHQPVLGCHGLVPALHLRKVGPIVSWIDIDGPPFKQQRGGPERRPVAW